MNSPDGRSTGSTPVPGAMSTPPRIEFEVLGIPKPQGSKRAFVVNGRARMAESSGGHAAWRNQVATVARDVAAALPIGETPLTGPLRLSVEFRFPMPKSRPKRVREAGNAPKTTAPDLDKLVRTVGDALTAAALIKDDSLICSFGDITKVETTGWTGAIITLEGAE